VGIKEHLPATLPQLESGWQEGEQLIAAHSYAEMAPKPAGGQAVIIDKNGKSRYTSAHGRDILTARSGVV